MRPRRGFTLIELLVVLAIVAVISVTAVAYGSSYVGRRQLEQAAVEMMQDLRRTQADAVFKRTTREVRYSISANSYSCETSTGIFQVVALRSGIELGSAEFGSGGSASPNLRFDAFGVPLPGGGKVVLAGASGATIEVTVSGVLGSVGMIWK
jgi:prepilin-type N-terminal cleavage/methylation domain-containing protein